MKTPREILLARHQAAEPKLDAIRQAAVAAVHDRRPSSSPTTRATIFETLWNELVLPSRRLWTGLAAAWLLILITNFSLRDSSTNATGATSPQVVMSLPQEEKLLAELSAPEAPAVAEPQKPYTPRPSSLRPLEIITT